MKNYLICFFLILRLSFSFAQEAYVKATLISSEKIDSDCFVGIDAMGSFYYLKNNVFYKKLKHELWQFKNIALGKITKVDIQNPLKIVLFYQQFNTVILLDNQLNEIQGFDFSQNSIPILVSATGIASQNQIWIFNSLSQQIGLFDYLKNSYKTIGPPVSGTILYYQTDFNTFQWIDNEYNWYSCDIFGKVIDLGRVSHFDQIQFISAKEFIFCSSANFFFKNTLTKKLCPIENLPKTFSNFFIQDQILAIFTEQEITNFKITKP